MVVEEEYRKASAAVHLGQRSSGRLLDAMFCQERSGGAAWGELLMNEETADWRRLLRRAINAGRTLLEKPEQDPAYFAAGQIEIVK